MNLYKNDGEKVLTFLKKNLGIDLPKSGVLAGQSICSVLLYLKGKKRDVHINDLDVFQMSPNHIDTIFVRNKCRPIYIGQIAAKRRENAYLFSTKKERDSFNKALKYPERLKNKAKEAEVGVGLRQRLHLTPQEHFEQITRQTEFSIEDVLDYAFVDRFIKPYSHCKTSLTEFTLERRFFAYEIDQVARRRLLNFVYVSGCQSIDKLTPNPNTILSGFDLNCCQVAIDLKNSQLYYTYPFVRFLESLQMEILCPSKPYQTMIRYFSKKEEFGFYGNDDLAIDLISTYKAIEEEVKKDESPLHNLHYGRYEDAGIPHNYKKFKIGRFGSRYSEKYRGLPSLKSAFGLITNELDFEPTKYGRKMFEKRGVALPKKVLLSELKPRQAGSSYILAGKHREELEKRLGTPTRDYVYYCLSSLPQIMKEHYRLSRGASVTNKWNSITSHLDKARTKRFRDEDLQIGFNNSAEEYANNYSPKTLSSISKLIAEHPCFVGAFRNVPHEIQISRLSFIKRLEKDDLELFYRAENCLGINWQTIDRSTYEAAKKHIKSVAYRERVKEDLLTNPDLEAEFLLDGCHVRQLTRRSELRKEGKDMGHCVGSYERRVKSKHSRIFTFVLKNGERATMETSGKNSPTAIRIIQFRGRFNGVVSKEMNTAGKEFLKMFKKGLKEKEQEDKEKKLKQEFLKNRRAKHV